MARQVVICLWGVLLLHWGLAQDVNAWLSAKGVEGHGYFSHEVAEGVWLYAIVSGNPGSSGQRGSPSFVSVVRWDGHDVEPLAEAVLSADVVDLHFIGFKDANEDGFPELIWVERLHTSSIMRIAITAIDLVDRSSVKFTWFYDPAGPLPQDVHPGSVWVERDAPYAPYLDTLLSNLMLSSLASDVVRFSDAAPAERAGFRGWVRSLDGDPTDLCDGYAVSAQVSLSLSVRSFRPSCNLAETVQMMWNSAAPFLAEAELAERDSDDFNIVRALGLGMPVVTDMAKVLDVLSRIPAALPPWQRVTFKQWVSNDLGLAALEILGHANLLVARDWGDRLLSDTLRARQLCRVEDAPQWCQTPEVIEALR